MRDVEVIAIFVGFAGGVFGRAWRFENALHRFAAFLVPMTLCALLLHVPLLLDVVHTGFAGANTQNLNAWTKAQMWILFYSFLITGAGWLYAACMETDIEGKSR